MAPPNPTIWHINSGANSLWKLRKLPPIFHVFKALMFIESLISHAPPPIAEPLSLPGTARHGSDPTHAP